MPRLITAAVSLLLLASSVSAAPQNQSHPQNKVGDIIDVVGTVEVEKGYMLRTDCLELFNGAEELKDDSLDEKEAMHLGGCRYALGNPRQAPNFPQDASITNGKRIRMTAKIGISLMPTQECDRCQTVNKDVIYLDPITIEELPTEVPAESL